MKQFLKYTLATIVGVLVASFIFLFISFGIVGSLMVSSEPATIIKPNSVYQLELNGTLVDRSEVDPFSMALNGLYGQAEVSLGLDDILSNIEKAKSNPYIAGIYLKGGTLYGGFASIKEIRDALITFKESGKFIVAYADQFTQKNYYLASVADKVILNPQGMLEWKGLSTEMLFLKNTLDKLGIEMQIVRVGTFKSAVEPFIETKMSDANREQVITYINSIWNSMLREVSDSRKITIEKLNEYADEMMMFQPTDKTMDYALVDSLLYIDQVEEVIKSYMNDVSADIHYVKNSAMNHVPVDVKYEKSKVAIIYAVGGIDDPTSRDGIISKDLVETIQKVAKDDAIKSVVLRVSSPGGSAYGSEQIWHALSELKTQKPLVVSMGDYAASGGYYIACMGDEILAQPNTITGSIGIFGQIPNLKGLNQKLGFNYDRVKTNKLSDAISINRPFTPEERNLMQGYVNRGYELFVKRCADGRGKTTDEIKRIAEGRVWTGEDALKIGLIDKLGGINDAIGIAANKADLTNYKVVEYPEKDDFRTKLMKTLTEDIEMRIIKVRLGEHYEVYKQLKHIEKLNTIQARLPYSLIIN